LTTVAWWAAVVLGGYLALVVAAAAAFVACARAPTRGSKATLPNGMAVTQWTDFETKFLYEEIWGKDSAYARGGIEFRPGSVVVDAGANVGLFSLFAAARCRGDATILSFEPIPTTYDVLAANAAAANAGAFNAVFAPAPRASLAILPFNVGLSDAAVPAVTFEHHPHLSIWSTADAELATGRVARITEDIVRATRASWNPLVWAIPAPLMRALLRCVLVRRFAATVPVAARLVPLAGVLDEYLPPDVVIDVLKVDVEGAEVSVLRGVRRDQWRRVAQVVMEVENFAARDAVTAILEGHGFKVTSVASEREKNPAALSEVSMVYAVRAKGWRPAAGAGAAGGAAPAPAAAVPFKVAPGATPEVIAAALARRPRAT
jgi:hypothetical protein